MSSMLKILTFTVFLTTCIFLYTALAENDAGKQPSDVYLEYIESAKNATTPEELTQYWSGWMAESFKYPPEDQKKSRLKRLKESAARKKEITVVGTEKTADHWIVNLKAVYPDGQKMKGRVKIIRENGKYLIEEEYWTGDLD